jgi:hypothetical protein
MTNYDVNIFNWGAYNDEGQDRVTLDAYPMRNDAGRGYYETDTSVDPITLQLTNEESAMLARLGLVLDDTWVEAQPLSQLIDNRSARLYTWLTALNN